MKEVKKTVCMLLAVTMLVVSLCGCDSQAQVTNTPTEPGQIQGELDDWSESTPSQEPQPTAPSSVDCWAQMQSATLQYPSANGEWEYNVYDCYIELTKYTGPEVETLIIPSEIDGLPVWALNTGRIYGGSGSDTNDILTSVEFSGCLLTIGDETFHWCRELTSFTLPDSLVSIGESAFENCFRLSSLFLPDGLQTIGDSAFDGAGFIIDSVPMITVPASVETIGYAAFRGISYKDDATRGTDYGYEITILNKDVELGEDCLEDAIVVYGYASSTAAQYCADYGETFKLIEAE